MDGWDALQMYDLVNDGHGNYYPSRSLDRNPKMREGIKTIFAIFSLEQEAREYKRLDKP